jgi:nucleoside-diphosphate-sugar epimerase
MTNLILGGTGKAGRRIARRLRAAGQPVRRASRSGGDVPGGRGAARSPAVHHRGYISTARKHGINVMTTIHDAVTSSPWTPLALRT